MANGRSVSFLPGGSAGSATRALFVGGGALQWYNSRAPLTIDGDLVLYRSSPNIPPTARSGMQNSYVTVNGAMKIDEEMTWTVWANVPLTVNTLVAHSITVNGGGRFTVEPTTYLYGTTSISRIITNTTFVVSGGSVSVAFQSFRHEVQFSSGVTLQAQNGYTGLLNISYGTVRIAGQLLVSDSSAVMVYDAIDPSALFYAWATLNVGGSFLVQTGSLLRVIGVPDRGSWNRNRTGSPYAVVFAPALTVDNSSTLRIDMDPTEPVAIPGVKVSVGTFSGPTDWGPGSIIITGSINPAFYQSFTLASLPQTAIPIQWTTNVSPNSLTTLLRDFPTTSFGGIDAVAHITATGLALQFVWVPPPPTGGVGPSSSSTGSSGGGDNNRLNGLNPGVAVAIAIGLLAFGAGIGLAVQRYRRSRASVNHNHQNPPLSAAVDGNVPFANFNPADK